MKSTSSATDSTLTAIQNGSNFNAEPERKRKQKSTHDGGTLADYYVALDLAVKEVVWEEIDKQTTWFYDRRTVSSAEEAKRKQRRLLRLYA